MKRAGVGDVFETSTPSGLAYLQYTHHDPFMGHLVRILPGRHTSGPNLDQVVSDQEVYFVFYLLDQALKQNAVRPVGSCPIPTWAKPLPLMRQAASRDRNGNVLSWMIGYNLPNTILRTVSQLTAEDRKLSISILIGHATLVEYLEWGWSPEREEEYRNVARLEVAAKSSSGKRDGASPVEHFLYFQKKRDADQASARLRGRAMTVIVRKGSDRKTWLVLAKAARPAVDDDLDKLRDEMEQVARDYNGKCDGWGMSV